MDARDVQGDVQGERLGEQPERRDRAGPGRDLPPGRLAPREGRVRRVARLATLLTAFLAAILVALTLTLTLVYRVVTPPSTPMLARWLTGEPVAREVVPLEAVSPNLLRAVIASEDQRFCAHHGVDWTALMEVVDDEDGPSRGASTITMQTVKNLFLWRGRSYLRKGLELPLALVADVVWGKRRTMDLYLNVAEWGEGVFGAQAAARHWFGKSARDLTPREAALLAAILPNPIARNPLKPSRGTRAKAARVQAQMGAIGDYMGCLAPR